MQWHIITGSKGGVGKTLQTLLLLKYYLERNKPNEGILVLDLNAMNADTSAMLLYNKKINQSFLLSLESKRKIILKQTFSLDQYEKPSYFGVGWPTNPFALYGYTDFADLLLSIKKHAETIATELNIPTLQHVIIDTNYHFCNLFRHDNYRQYTALEEDHVAIWFLWVYRQLKKLLEKDDDETKRMRLTANAIEQHFNSNEIGSIVHTYTPVGLLSAQPSPSNFLLRLFGSDSARRDQDYTIEKLFSVEKLPVGKPISFNEWITKLQVAHTLIKDKKKHDDPHLLFVDVLDEAVRQIADHGEELSLPINLFPLLVYQSALEGYTDGEREDAVARLGRLTLYEHFSKLLDRKYESLRL